MWNNDWKHHNSYRERPVERSAVSFNYNFYSTESTEDALDSNNAEDNIEGSYWHSFKESDELDHREQRSSDARLPKRFYCTLCSLDLGTEKAYQSHLLSLVHRKKQTEAESIENELDKGKSKLNNETRQNNDIIHDQYYCEVCNCTLKSKQAYDSHCKSSQHSQNVSNYAETGTNAFRPQQIIPNQAGQRAQIMQMFDKISEPLVGLECVTEVYPNDRRLEPYYVCSACDCQCDARSIYSHVIGAKHCLHFLQKFYPDYYKVLKHHQGPGHDKTSELKVAIDHYVQLAYLKAGRGEVFIANETEKTTRRPPTKLKASSATSQQSDAMVSDSGDSEMPSSSTMKSNVRQLLQSLAEIEVTNEEEASLAFQISNILTKALIKYRKNTLSSDMPEQQHDTSYSKLEDM